MDSWCLNIQFPNECNIRHFNLTKEKREIHIRINVLLMQWLVDISALAVHYGNIAYGNTSFESGVFNDILKIWTKFYMHDDDGIRRSMLEKPYDFEEIQETHKATQQAILLLI